MSVIPAQAGIQPSCVVLGPGFRRGDEIKEIMRVDS